MKHGNKPLAPAKVIDHETSTLSEGSRLFLVAAEFHSGCDFGGRRELFVNPFKDPA